MPETSDPYPYRVSSIGGLFARAAFRDGPAVVDQATLQRIVERAIEVFETGNVHTARALLYLATPTPRIAASALDALGIPPRPRWPYTGPPPDPDAASPAGAAAGLLDRLPDGGVTRPLTRPVQAQALPWEDAHRDRDGRLLGVYVPVPVLWPPQLCQHGETICPHCLLSWADNHALALFDHGPDGAAAGCTCPTCQPDPGTPTPHSQPSPRQAQQAGKAGPPETAGPVAPRGLTGPTGRAANPREPDDRRGIGGIGGSGVWLCRQVEAGGHAVGLGVQPGTGLTLVCYPDGPPPRLGTGPHLAVVAVLAEVIDQLAGHIQALLTPQAPARLAGPLTGEPAESRRRPATTRRRRTPGGVESNGGR